MIEPMVAWLVTAAVAIFVFGAVTGNLICTHQWKDACRVGAGCHAQEMFDG